jgi:hypothetical protein
MSPEAALAGDATRAVAYNKPMDYRVLTPALVVVVVAAALLTGCGGGNSDQKANDAYASRVCTASGNWLTEVKSVDTVPSFSGITKASIDAKLNHFETATKQFVSRIKAIPAPNTSEGRAAKKEIDRQLIPSAQGESNSAKTVASTIVANGSMTQVVAALAALPDYQTLKATTQQTLTLSAGGSLASAFKSERACKHLG